ncbi:MAG: protein-glutamate O-methyltransferase CheR [Deltaproteobacteria bacterium]|nr:protein-glutamate O-methyltransferase CheR [Deltaproteobacteria bacterium]
MRIGDPAAKLSLERFRLLRDMFNRHCGIFFSDESRFLLESRLGERLLHLGLESFDDYYRHLNYHPEREAEVEEAIDILTTNETYFFREDYQLRTFGRDILHDLRDRLAPRRRLMIWSAGCSSGEEAYTIAMLVLDSGLFDGWDVRVFGSDINRKVLARARRAVYGPSSFRATAPDVVARHFGEVEDGYRVNDDVRALCHFGHLNLLDEERLVFVGRADVIFCRNVLIYFDKRAKTRAISLLHDRLSPGGYLLLGHTESLLNLSTEFELCYLSEDLVYRRPEVLHGE